MAREMWALLYLHDWDPPKEGQEHKWEPGKNIFPEISSIYESWQEAEAVRAKKIEPGKYWVRRVRVPQTGPTEPLRCLRCGTVDAFGPAHLSEE